MDSRAFGNIRRQLSLWSRRWVGTRVPLGPNGGVLLGVPTRARNPRGNPTYLPMGAPEGTGISSNLVLELLHGPEAQWSPVGEGVPEMTRLEKIPWEGEFTLRSDS